MEKTVLEKSLIKDVKIVLKTNNDIVSNTCLSNRKNAVHEFKMAEFKQFTIKNKTIKCTLYDDEGCIIAVGKSKCHPEDTFDYNIGMIIAEGRADIKKIKKQIEMLSK